MIFYHLDFLISKTRLRLTLLLQWLNVKLLGELLEVENKYEIESRFYWFGHLLLALRLCPGGCPGTQFWAVCAWFVCGF